MTLEKYMGRHMTKKEFAKEMGVTRPTLDKYISDPGLMPLCKAIKFCELSTATIDDVLGIVSEKNN